MNSVNPPPIPMPCGRVAFPAKHRAFPALAVFILSSLVLAIYGQTGWHAFVQLDDIQYIRDNPIVADGLSLRSVFLAFSTFHAGNFHPLTWLSHIIDVELFGLQPGPHHLESALFHLVNALLLFFGLRKLTGRGMASLLAAAMFAAHPLAVETVAWAAERKNVLSTTFWFLAVGAYASYAARGSRARYLLSLLLFAFGLLTKPMLVTLPFTLLLLDWWPLARMEGAPGTVGVGSTRKPITLLVREKIPFFLLSAVSSAVTFVAQQRFGAVPSIDAIPLGSRAANAAVSSVAYLGRALWPSSLAPFYPPPWWSSGIPAWQIIADVLLLAAVTAYSLYARHRRPWLTTGWLWYLGTLVPVVGLVQVGSQGSADRYTYVPLIGIFTVVSWEACLGSARRLRPIIATGAWCAVLLLGVVSARQTFFWRDGIRLFGRGLQVTSGNWPLHTDLGAELAERGRDEEALAEYRKALAIRPNAFQPHAGAAAALARLGRSHEAEAHFARAARLAPRNVAILNNYAVFLQGRGRHKEAASLYRNALAIQPNEVELQINLASCLLAVGDFPEAEQLLRAVLRTRPRRLTAHNDLGIVLLRTGRPAEAITHFEEILRVSPGDRLARENLALARRMRR